MAGYMAHSCLATQCSQRDRVFSRLGSRQHEAIGLLLIADRAGTPVHPSGLARRVGPHGSTYYGWRTIQRLILRGIVVVTPDPDNMGRGWKRIDITPLWREFLAYHYNG